eukprot:586368-Pelagomonas_calceolata.AAC.4
MTTDTHTPRDMTLETHTPRDMTPGAAVEGKAGPLTPVTWHLRHAPVLRAQRALRSAQCAMLRCASGSQLAESGLPVLGSKASTLGKRGDAR